MCSGPLGISSSSNRVVILIIRWGWRRGRKVDGWLLLRGGGGGGRVRGGPVPRWRGGGRRGGERCLPSVLLFLTQLEGLCLFLLLLDALAFGGLFALLLHHPLPFLLLLSLNLCPHGSFAGRDFLLSPELCLSASFGFFLFSPPCKLCLSFGLGVVAGAIGMAQFLLGGCGDAPLCTGGGGDGSAAAGTPGWSVAIVIRQQLVELCGPCGHAWSGGIARDVGRMRWVAASDLLDGDGFREQGIDARHQIAQAIFGRATGGGGGRRCWLGMGLWGRRGGGSGARRGLGSSRGG